MRPWTDGISLPVLIDPQHVLTELYAITNVPTVVWIDEDDRIVRPNGVAFSNDMFAEFTGARAGPHLDALRAWVRDGTVSISPDEARAAVPDLSDDEVQARLHFRIATEAAPTRRRRDRAPALRTRGRAGTDGLHHPPRGHAADGWRSRSARSSWSCTRSGMTQGARSTVSHP